jgi:hypothetical protein
VPLPSTILFLFGCLQAFEPHWAHGPNKPVSVYAGLESPCANFWVDRIDFLSTRENVSMLFGWVKHGCFVACILILFLLGFGANNKKFIA